MGTWASRVNDSTGFGQVYDYWVLGPVGLWNNYQDNMAMHCARMRFPMGSE